MAASVGSFMNSAAAILPPTDLVWANRRRAWSLCHRPAASRTPGLVAIEVTISALAAWAKSMTAFQRSRLSTALKPLGGVGGASSLSAKYVVLAHVPLTRK